MSADVTDVVEAYVDSQLIIIVLCIIGAIALCLLMAWALYVDSRMRALNARSVSVSVFNELSAKVWLLERDTDSRVRNALIEALGSDGTTKISPDIAIAMADKIISYFSRVASGVFPTMERAIGTLVERMLVHSITSLSDKDRDELGSKLYTLLKDAIDNDDGTLINTDLIAELISEKLPVVLGSELDNPKSELRQKIIDVTIDFYDNI